MSTPGDIFQDVMQVCRNGHVITDLLRSQPGRGLSHCDRCGATTLDRCPTCGRPLLGATAVPGLSTLGTRPPPQRCAGCGAAFPWADQPAAIAAAAPPEPLDILVTFLRRLPRAIRQLRSRHRDRPPFLVKDECDLDDLLRALLPLHFDEIRSESRTPPYACGNRTDFRIGQVSGTFPLAVTAKLFARGMAEAQLAEQWREDLAYYGRVRDCQTVVGFVYDPEGLLRDAGKLEAAWSRSGEKPDFRCVIAC
jgi:hypothetical protein